MTESQGANAPDAPPGQGKGAGAARPAGRQRAALLAGSTTALVTASLVGSALGLLNKAACRAGDWNFYLKQMQAHCYTDIYPLYFSERLSAGKVPYTGHPVEYPVLMGWAMQAVAWLVRPIGDPFVRGREFFDVTVVMLALFSLAATLATAYLAGRSRRWTALGVALAPGLILASFVNWDLIAMGLVALGMAAWAARRNVLAGVLLGLAVATKFYPLFFFGPLLLLCLICAGGHFARIRGHRPLRRRRLAGGQPAGRAGRTSWLGALLLAQHHPPRGLGIHLVLLRNRALAVPGLAVRKGA